MRTEQLEYVAAIARHGSFRRAAEELHISQPALSETIRKLEAELGVALFRRGRDGASLTADGSELLGHVTGVIDAVDGLRRAADAQHHASRVVRVATVAAGTVPVLTPALRDFHEVRPDTQVEVIGAREEEINRGLRDGSFDLGLVNRLQDEPGDAPGLESVVVLSGPPVVCLSPRHPLAERDVITPAQLRSAPLVAMRAGYLMRRYLVRLFDGEPPAPAYAADGAEMGKLMVAEGLGVTLLPEFSVRADPLHRAGLITWRPLAVAQPVEVALLLRRRRAAARGRAARDLHRLILARGRGQQVPAPLAA